jgi:hypothetical protein
MTDASRFPTVPWSWREQVAQAASEFNRLWSIAKLNEIDRDLHDRLVEQKALFLDALVNGDADEIAVHGAAMCRGWEIAHNRMWNAMRPELFAGRNFQQTMREYQQEIAQGAAHRAAEQQMLDGMNARPQGEQGAPPFERRPGETMEEANIRRAHELREWHTQGRPARPPRPARPA